MKVWCYNCYGVCIARMEVNKIEQWNASHPIVSEKIKFWGE